MRVPPRPKHLADGRKAGRSTGPKTSAGKALSSQNALKHGLTAAVAPWADQKARALAAELAGVGVRGEPLELAQASVALLRIRTARSALLGSCLPGEAIDLAAMRVLLTQLSRLDRYERQARVRQRKQLATAYQNSRS
jgi:hypothetical protein